MAALNDASSSGPAPGRKESLVDPTGKPIFSKNITFDEATGIGRWSLEDFEQAVTRGVNPEGLLVRKPMPTFSRLDRTDVEAIYLYLQTVPRAHRPNVAGGAPVEKPNGEASAESLFVSVGCVTRHGPVKTLARSSGG